MTEEQNKAMYAIHQQMFNAAVRVLTAHKNIVVHYQTDTCIMYDDGNGKYGYCMTLDTDGIQTREIEDDE